MTRTIYVDADDAEAVAKAMAEGAQYFAATPKDEREGFVILLRVMHEPWCPKPAGKPCVCRDDYREPTGERIALARRRAKNKAASKARRKGRR